MLVLLLLAAAQVLAGRRLSDDVCAASVYVLAEGAPTGTRGRSWGPGLADPLHDASGVGTRLLAGMPACQRAKAVSLRVHDAAEAMQAAVWLDAQCASRECLVYTLYDLPARHAYAVARV